jgi:hypothetical protein
LRPGEIVLARRKPEFAPFVLSSLGLAVFGVVWLIIPTVIAFALYTRPVSGSAFAYWAFQLFTILFVLIGLAMLLAPIYNAITYRFIDYVITSRRIVVVRGLLGGHVKLVDLSAVISTVVTVSLVDRAYGTGTVKFYTGMPAGSAGTTVVSPYDCLYAVRDPFALLRVIDDSIVGARGRA